MLNFKHHRSSHLGLSPGSDSEIKIKTKRRLTYLQQKTVICHTRMLAGFICQVPFHGIKTLSLNSADRSKKLTNDKAIFIEFAIKI